MDNIFDGTERVIGLWFGKPLYRRTITKNVPANSQGTVDLSSYGYATIWVDHGNSFNQYSGTQTSSGTQWTNNDQFNDYGLVYINPSRVLNIKNWSASNRDYYITLNYTTTTD